MMYKVIFLSICFAFLFSAFGSQPQKINVQDFGLFPGVADCTPGLIKALKSCKESMNAELVFPKGEYHFYPDFGIDKYCFVSNNDEGLKRVIFPLIGFENLTINGNGSSFIFHGFVNPFVLENAANITFKDFTMDCARPFHSEAIILANNTDGIDVEIPANFPYKLKNGLLLFTDGAVSEEQKTTVNRPMTYP